ncbi:MAG: Mut7-C RNAse domain-containing protein [Anaerolineae bacterium]|nr:Mut7-C RNAse domain-containing protein [Anaerolineae bacterium]
MIPDYRQTDKPTTAPVKLLADGMLGRLAKWLRILGFDTLYDPSLDDHALLRLARAEGRILLTCDRELAHRRGAPSLLIESTDLESQLRQVIRDLHLSPDAAFSRCPVCNTPLEALEKEAVRDRVPAHVFRTHTEFSRCPHCDRVYWSGTHRARMLELISRLQHPPDP